MGEREREKLRDILQAMAIESNHVDMGVSNFLWSVVKRLADGGSMAGLTRQAYWRVRAIADHDGWARFTCVWHMGSREWSTFLPMCCVMLPPDAATTLADGGMA